MLWLLLPQLLLLSLLLLILLPTSKEMDKVMAIELIPELSLFYSQIYFLSDYFPLTKLRRGWTLSLAVGHLD